jgi:TonB family protein
MPPSEDFYPDATAPPGFKNEVVLDYGVEPGSGGLKDVRVVSNKWAPQFDAAALGMAREAHAKGGCAGVRYRTTIVFTATSAKPPERSAPTAIVDVTAGDAHVNGDAHWNSVLLRSLSAVCGLTGADRKVELGDKATPEPRIDADDCTATSAFIHNTTTKPIYCHAQFDLADPDESGRTRIEGQRMVMPDAMEMMVTAYGNLASSPQNATSTCDMKDAPPPPPMPKCDAKFLTFPDVDSFYPAASQRREEQGDVILDFRIDSEARKVRDIRVSQGSGYPELDLAALKAGREISATTNCPDLRRKVKIKFRLVEDTPPPTSPATPSSGKTL